MALIVVIIWGLNFSVIKFGLAELPPILFSGLRFLVVAIPAVFFIPFPNTSVWNVLGVGLFLGVLKFSLLFIAMESNASAGIASLLLQAQVIFTILLSVLLLKETMDRFQVVGISIATFGFSLFFINSSGSTTMLGAVLILFAALFWSFSNLIMKRLQDVNLLHFIVWVSLVPPLPLFTLSYFIETDAPLTLLLNTTTQSWLSIAYVGYISTLIAFAIWGWLLKNHKAAAVTPFALLIPIVGIVGSALLLNERLMLIEAIGGGFILCGLTISVTGARISKIFRKPQAEAIP
ncbi:MULTISPECIES: EamA family transporter [unclassified Pseudoalteromonas]|uniref:EamA family transporter n=2 Tax=Pseudoalteromonas TaxID=53246 RepID=UPI001F392A7A|nr:MULTISPECIES: EamA family transporter [unclassified Pseudoalteromonas]MCF2825183.1 EamA family transporter [Pseudoalteromonas sp. OF5H-5]MCF2833576.1 EamA family transporter [Pseudoalteromonas sp. DL2-H6]MCF2927037.1 EamA family transporter [Pseudoalteromonas sp. DL2-H1]MCG7553024.1 EamA family transporter [Pseudoalteromonas sp. Of11M-6]